MKNVIQFNNLDFGSTGKYIVNREIDLDQYGWEEHCVYNTTGYNAVLEYINNGIAINWSDPNIFNRPTKKSFAYACKINKNVFKITDILNIGKYVYNIHNGYMYKSTYEATGIDRGQFTGGTGMIFFRSIGTNSLIFNAAAIKYKRVIAVDNNVAENLDYACLLAEFIIDIERLYNDGWDYFAFCNIFMNEGNWYNNGNTTPYSLANSCIDKPVLNIISEA